MYSKNYLDIRDCLSQCQLAFLGHSTLLLTLTATGLPPLACVMVLPAFLGWEEVYSLKRWTIREWMAKNLWVAGSKNVWPPRAHANHISLGRSCYQTMQLLTSHVNLDAPPMDWTHGPTVPCSKLFAKPLVSPKRLVIAFAPQANEPLHSITQNPKGLWGQSPHPTTKHLSGLSCIQHGYHRCC